MRDRPSVDRSEQNRRVLLYERVATCLATGFGLGSIAPAPGTFGSAIWGLPFAWVVGHLPGLAWQIPVVLAAILFGVPLTTVAGRVLGSKKDNQAIIWDEIATIPIVFLLVPLTTWKVALLGFILHPLFDITKPPPARQLEHLPDGAGVMADDVMAAIYACLLLGGLAWLDRHFGGLLIAAAC
jgi:phosphatidylglycerophosphatase A